MCVRLRVGVRVIARMRQVVPVSRYVSTVRDTVRRSYRMSMRGPDSVHLVPTGIVAVVSPAVAAGKTEDSHGGHTRGSKNHAEDVEIHCWERRKDA
jgi:hypothetical protein